MVGRDVYFYADSTDFDKVRNYYDARPPEDSPPTREILAFISRLRADLNASGLSEDQVFEPACEPIPENASGPGLYVVFEDNQASTAAQMIAFHLAREVGVGTLDPQEESNGWDSTLHYYKQAFGDMPQK